MHQAKGVTVQQPFFSKTFLYSLGLHAVIFLLLILSFEFSSKMPVLENTNRNDQIISAVVTSAPVENILPKPTPVPPQPLNPEPIKPVPPAKPILKPVAKAPAIVQQKNAIAISDKKQKLKKQKELAEQLLEDIKKQTEDKKKLKHKELAKTFQSQMKNLAAKSLQEEMLKEEKRLAGEKDQQMQGVVDKYKALILQAIAHHWLVPASVNKNLSTQLMIRVAAGGTVIDVQLIKSSGDPILDRSARAAVFKASPLPVPKDADAFAPFKQFVLKVKPENLVNTAEAVVLTQTKSG